MKLVYESSGLEVKIGDSVTLRNGLNVKVLSVEKPHKPSSTGRVYVDGEFNGSPGYYPSVIGAKWIEREDQV